MEVDEQEASGSSNELTNSISSIINLQNDSEPMPAVEIGSESWHDQVPAVSILLIYN